MASTGRVHKDQVDVWTSPVSLKQDFKTFLVSQGFVVEVQESFLQLSNLWPKSCFVQLDYEVAPKLSEFSKNFLVAATKLSPRSLLLFCLLQSLIIEEKVEMDRQKDRTVFNQVLFSCFGTHQRSCDHSQFNLECLFQNLRHDVVVVDHFFIGRGTEHPLFPMVTTIPKRVALKGLTSQVWTVQVPRWRGKLHQGKLS